MLGLFTATSLDLSAQATPTISLDASVSYDGQTFPYSPRSTPYRVCPGIPIVLTPGDAVAACGDDGVLRAFYVTGTLTPGSQEEITPSQPGNSVQVDPSGIRYFRYCVRCNNNDPMIESDAIYFQSSGTTEEGADCDEIVLPVELASFKGTNVEAGISLDWITDSELDNEGFQIEFSTDARSFEKIAFVTGNGTTNQRQSYQYTHKTNRPGSLYYRLKQMDFDGAFEYSDIIEVMREKTNNGSIVIFPNPAKEAFRITISNPERLNASVKVSDLLGKIIFETSFRTDEAPEFFEKEISSLSQQMYIVTTRIGTVVTSHQVANLN